MTDKSFEEGICIGMLFGGGGGTSKPVIKSLSVTKNGKYTASTGVDGYSPVNVDVPDRYEEGYNDALASFKIVPLSVKEPGVYHASSYNCNGFDPVSVSDIYKKLYEQAIGNGDDAIDDDGNVIPDAISTDDTDDLTDLLTHIQFGPYGGSVTVQGLDADTMFTFEQQVTKVVYADGTVRYRTKSHGTVKHRHTGKTVSINGKSYEAMSGVYKIHITDVKFYSVSLVQIKYDIGSVKGITMQFNAGSVGGTCFYKTSPIATTTNQNTQPNETIDYS